MMEFDEIVVKESPGLCRCCLSEGCYKDLGTEYTWMNETEVYADMLLECFDISITQHNEGPNGPNRLICEVCITRLRDACNFKKQVMDSEKKFIDMMGRGEFRPKMLIYQTKLKCEEPSAMEDPDETEVEYLEDDLDFGDDDLKEELIQPSVSDVTVATLPVKGKRGRPRKNTPVKPDKRAKVAKVVDKAKTSKAVAKGTRDKPIRHTKNYDEDYDPKPGKRKNGLKPIRHPKNDDEDYEPKRGKGKKGLPSEITEARLEMMEEIKKHHTNLKEILTCSNATPFAGVNYRGYVCCYCDFQYPDPAALKKHTRDNHIGSHDSVIPSLHKNTLDEFCIKLDITDLRCTLCDCDIDTLENLITHLKGDHKRDIYTEIKNQLFPFKFNSETLKCCVCSSVFETFRKLLEHMHIHYRNFICDECDVGFITQGTLRKHVAVHAIGVFKCNFCSKTFVTKTRVQCHERSVHVNKGMKGKCEYCNEKFNSLTRRDEHLVKIHGVKLKVIKCQACDRTFPNTYALRIHTRRDHLMERRFKCTLCDKAFFQAANLKFHQVKHTKSREFQCTVCLKSYGRRVTLIQHMEIHSDVRRFQCKHCGQAFVQKASWKGHMRSKHEEIV